MTLGQLIEVLGGRLAQGDQEWRIDGVSSSDLARPSDLVFAEDAAAATAALASDAGLTCGFTRPISRRASSVISGRS